MVGGAFNRRDSAPRAIRLKNRIMFLNIRGVIQMNKVFSLSVLSGAILAPAASFAAEGVVVLSSLTDSFSVAPVTTGVLAIAGALLGLYAMMRGAKIILALVRGGSN